MGVNLCNPLCITSRVQGSIAIRYGIVAMDSGLGQGLRRVEVMQGGMGPEPCLIYRFNRFTLINLFLTTRPINIVLA